MRQVILNSYDKDLVLDWFFYSKISIKNISKKLKIPRNKIEFLLKENNLSSKNRYDKGKLCTTCLLIKSLYEFNNRTNPKCSLCEKIYHQICNSTQSYKNKRKEYRKNNKHKINLYYRDKNKKNIYYKLSRIIKNSINRSIIGNKNGKAIQNLPFTIDQLKNHLENLFEPWMSWGNYGKCKSNWDDNDPSTWTWQIAHIIPHSTFKYKNFDDILFLECWSLSNLRPYSSKQNCIDGGSKIRHNIS